MCMSSRDIHITSMIITRSDTTPTAMLYARTIVSRVSRHPYNESDKGRGREREGERGREGGREGGGGGGGIEI